MQHSARGNIVYTRDIPDLSNDQGLPVLVIMIFLNGCFAMPSGSRSLTEEMLQSDGTGAVKIGVRLSF